MNKHIFFDRLTAAIGAKVAGKKKFFSQSINSLSFEELVKRTETTAPEINGEGTFEVRAVTPAGILDPAFRVEKWVGTGHPTIIYHHGNNERPFDYRKGAKNSFLNIFVKERDAFDANLIVVRAPFHNSSLKEYQVKMTDLQNFMAMIAAAVKLNEALIVTLRQHSDQPVITCGMSLGGWVTNLHRAIFNSADRYAPLMAGALLGELFLESRYRKMTGENALEAAGEIRALLNFDGAFGRVKSGNVYPLLAKYDQFIEYPVQVKSYEGMDVRTIENGHVTAAVNSKGLRQHIIEVLNMK